MTELNKTFDPAEIEKRWYAHWESTGAFRPHRPDATPYTIVMPPPNVTGSLHIGHALDNTLQDILIRYERLRGKDALWVAGTDHAGIATQMVVERQMAAAQDKRTNYSREDFIAKVWEWKAESGGQITQQLRRLGASCDWANERFTMDEGFSKAVLKVFVDMYNEGLIYRDKRLVNWDPGLKTAISDLEVETREINGKFWHFRYPLADGARTADGKDYIVVATTRPETMLADMAVAVNAKDERYQSLLAAKAQVILPITGRRIPIIADDHADPELGSGAVKVTPGHDFNDFEVGKRAGIAPAQMLNMLDAEARVQQLINEEYQIPREFFLNDPVEVEIDEGHYFTDYGIGVDRFEARKIVVQMIEKDDLLDKVEDRVIQTPFGDRSGVVIEPWLTDQWYVDAAKLAEPAIEAVRNGDIKIVPESWTKTWFQWLENIQPWCISRQLWWGHQIPVWYGPLIVQGVPAGYLNSDMVQPIVAADEDHAIWLGRKHYENKFDVHCAPDQETAWRLTHEARNDFNEGRKQRLYLYRDPDVLDTWFSSALWPFATLGWPDAESPSPSGEGLGVGTLHQIQPSDSLNLPTPTPPLKGRGLLSRHYPNDVLISGFDILFFWDARMAMQGLHQMKQIPWKTLYLHGLVRAADGSKMSKSKGNTVDPLGLIDRYGADALRFFMAAMESQGRDIKMDEKRLEGYRNFATKLWNAARFCQANGIGASTSVAAPAATLAVNKWIIGEVVETVAALDKALADLRFDEAAHVVYHFVWDQFCDWYLELIKPVLSKVEGATLPPSPRAGEGARLSDPQERLVAAGEGVVAAEHPSPDLASLGHPLPQGEREKEETRAVAGWVLDQILVMLHPFMPFITEEVWHAMGARGGDLIHAEWVNPGVSVDSEAKAEIEWLVGLIESVRSIRTEYRLPWSEVFAVQIADDDPVILNYIKKYTDIIGRLLKIAMVQVKHGTKELGSSEHFNSMFAQQNGIQFTACGQTFILLVPDTIDLTAERSRLTKAIEAATKEAAALAARLANPAFVEKAKPEAVEKARADHAEKSAEAERLQAALARLG